MYRAAIVIPTQSVIPQMISDAEQAVISRSRQLFGTMSTIDEKEAPEDGLYMLRAFRRAWQNSKVERASSNDAAAD